MPLELRGGVATLHTPYWSGQRFTAESDHHWLGIELATIKDDDGALLSEEQRENVEFAARILSRAALVEARVAMAKLDAAPDVRIEDLPRIHLVRGLLWVQLGQGPLRVSPTSVGNSVVAELHAIVRELPLQSIERKVRQWLPDVVPNVSISAGFS